MPDSLTHALQRRARAAARTGARPLCSCAPSRAWPQVSRRAAALVTPAPRRTRSVARTLDRLAAAAQDGALRPRQIRPPRSVIELGPQAASIREVAVLLRGHEDPPQAVVAACDRFADACWNGALRGLDHEHHRRELGRIRFLLLV